MALFTFYKQRVLMTLQSVEATSILKWALVVKWGLFQAWCSFMFPTPFLVWSTLCNLVRGLWLFCPRSCFLLQPFFVQLHLWVLFFLGCWSFLFVPLIPLLDWCFFFNKVYQWLIIVDYCFHFWVNGTVLTFKIIGFYRAWGNKGLGVFTNWMDEF